MRKTTALIAVMLTCTLATAATADTIKIAGSGGMIPLLNELSKAYLKKNPKDTIEVEQKSIGVSGGLMKLNKGLIDIAMAANKLNNNQQKLHINSYEIATVPGLFGVNSNVIVKELSSQQICDIYGGKITNWKQVGGSDAKIIPLTRPEDESIKVVMREGIACFASLKEGPATILIAKSTEMFTQLSNTPNSIGMMNLLYLIESAGKIVAPKMDGKEVMKSAKAAWPLQHHLQLVTSKQPTEATKRFMHFVASPDGQAVIKKEKAEPVPFKS